MASASGIRAGRTYVEVGADDSQLAAVLARVQRQLRAMGDSFQAIGKQIGGVGLAAAAPFAVATKSFASFDDAMANLRANVKPTADELAQITAAAADIGKSTGVGPTKVIQAMTELRKAGLPLKDVLETATKAALQFARVAELDVAKAAVVLNDNINLFGVDAVTAADALSRAADGSSASLEEIVLAMSQFGTVAKGAGLSIGETANLIAIMSNQAVKGSDAGTSLKTALLKLRAPADEGAAKMKELGINVRKADLEMKDARGIVGELQSKLGGLNAKARDEALSKIFGTDAIRAGEILLKLGTKGFDEVTKSISEGLSVAEKYNILMGTLSGLAQRTGAALEGVAIEVGSALAPALAKAGAILAGVINGIGEFLKQNKALVVTVAKSAAAAVGIGVALVALGAALKVAAVGFAVLRGVVVVTTAVIWGIHAAFVALNTAIALGSILVSIGSTLAAIATPAGLLTIAVLALGAALGYAVYQSGIAGKAFASVKETAIAAFGGIADALKAGDLALAGRILWAALKLEFTKGINFLKALWADWGTAAIEAWRGFSFELASRMIDLWAGLRAGFVLAVGFMKDTWAGFTAFFEKAMNTAVGRVAEELATAKSFFTTGGGLLGGKEKLQAELKLIKDLTVAKNAAVDKRLAGRGAGTAAEVAGIATDRLAQRQALADQEGAEQGARRKAAAAGLAGDAKGLADAQRELRDALDEVDAGLLDDILGGGDTTTTAPAALPGGGPAGLDKSLDHVHGKIDTKGTFSAAAVAGLGVGDSVNDAVKEQVKEQKETNKKLDKIADKITDSKPVFGV